MQNLTCIFSRLLKLDRATEITIWNFSFAIICMPKYTGFFP